MNNIIKHLKFVATNEPGTNLVEVTPGTYKKKLPSTRDSMCISLNIKPRTANKWLTRMKRLGYIEADIKKSYMVSNKSEKAFKWVYRLTTKGQRVLDRHAKVS